MLLLALVLQLLFVHLFNNGSGRDGVHCQTTQAAEQFFVVFPKLIHTDSSTNVWVHRQRASSALIRGTLEVHKQDETENATTREILITSLPFILSNTKKLTLNLPSEIKGIVRIRVQLRESTQSGVLFDKSTKVIVHPIERLIFIQTDKPVYKPGDLVRFRVLAVRKDSLTESDTIRSTTAAAPAYYSQIQLIKPSRRNVAVWQNQSWQAGFKGMEVRLEEDNRQIEFGNYNITVELVSGEMMSSKFEVKKFVLPTFTVTLTPPDYVLAIDQQMKFEVCAKYTFGKPVIGRAKAKVCQSKTICREITQNLKRDGCARYQIKYDEHKDQKSFTPRNNLLYAYTFEATVFEEDTDKFVATKDILKVSVLNKPFKLTILSTKFFSPGLPYAGIVQATNHDGKPFPKPNVTISLREDWWSDGRKWGFEMTKVGDDMGKIEFQLPVLPSTLRSITIVAQSKGHGEKRTSTKIRSKMMEEALAVETLKKRSTASGSVMRAEILGINTNKNSCPTNLTLLLTANVPLYDRAIHAQVSSRGQIFSWRTSSKLITDPSPCRNQNGLYGHYECSRESGKARCLIGWTGTDCLTPICQQKCLNGGICVAPDVCKCDTGFTGGYCQTCVKNEKCINGRCKDSRKCVCYFPFTGINCNIQKANFDWKREPRGPGNGGTNRSEWILQVEEQSALEQIKTTESTPTALVKEAELQNITINFRMVQLRLTNDDGVSIATGARLVIFSVNGNGEILSDSMRLNDIITCLPNDATKAEFQFNQVQPGRTLDLLLSTTGTDSQCAISVSDVGLSAIADQDKNAPSINNLVKEIQSIQNELYSSTAELYNHEEYCKVFETTPNPTASEDDSSYTMPVEYRPDFLDASFSFDYAGIILLTNQKLHTANCSSYEGDNIGRSGVTNNRDNDFQVEQTENPISRVRQNFPDSWLWNSFFMEPGQQQHRMSVIAPDSITSWQADLVCIGSHGIGMAPASMLTVFQPFFIMLAMPLSAVRGERLRLPVSVHSYADSCYQVDIQLSKEPMSQIETLDGTERQLCMCSADKSKVTTTFDLRFLRPQNQSIIFHATASPASALCVGERSNRKAATALIGATDAVKRFINVVPEGVPESATQSALLCGKGANAVAANETFHLRMPERFVPLSLARYLAWTADIMGPTLSNLENLVKMPYGCGEQNLATMVPSIFVLKYLHATRTSNAKLEMTAKRYINEGYQRQLKYRRADGSFSAFGAKDAHGSTWLTAFVVRSFCEAASIHTDINKTVNNTLASAIDYLLSLQNRQSGCFEERGRVLSTYMQGGVGQESELALTAYVMPAMTAHVNRFPADHVKIYRALQQSVDCLIRGDYLWRSNYVLAMATYALSNMQLTTEMPSDFQDYLNQGRASIRSKLQGNYNEKFLPTSNAARDQPILPKSGISTWWRPSHTSVQVETTAYALLALLNEEPDQTANLPLVRWLTAQRNAYGGWRSTQDTVVSLRALSEFGTSFVADDVKLLNVTIIVETRYENIRSGAIKAVNRNETDVIEQHVSEENRLVEHVHKLSPFSRKITVQAQGTGCIVVVANTLFNLPEPIRPEAPFAVNITVSNNTGKCDIRKIQIAVRYTGTERESGMALLRLRLPTGWFVDEVELQRLLNQYESSSMKRAELDGEEVEMYLDSIAKSNQQIYSINIKQKYAVKDLKASVLIVADYYQPELNREVMLNIGECQESFNTTKEPLAPTQQPDAPPSCPVCAPSLAESNNISAINASADVIVNLLCSQWSSFVLTSQIHHRGQIRYKVLRPDDEGAVSIWKVNSLYIAPICYEQCPLLYHSIQPNQLLLISRYSYQGGLWPGSNRLAPNENFIMADADMSFDLERRYEQISNNSDDCPGRIKLQQLVHLEKERQIEREMVNKANVVLGGCPICLDKTINNETMHRETKRNFCDAYSKTGSSLTYNRLYMAKSVLSQESGVHVQLEGIGSTEQLLVQLILPNTCTCNLLQPDKKEDNFFMVPPEGWTARNQITLDKAYILIPEKLSTALLKMCRETTESTDNFTEGSGKVDNQSNQFI